MKRIDTATAGAGGVFTDGNVVTGVLPTVLDASWLNMVQDELHSPLDFLGIASDPNSDTQLLEAIQALAASYTVGGFPVTGVAGAVFAKNSATNGDASWISPGSLPGAMPTGGTADQVLRKVDGTDYNYAWTSVSALPNAVPTGGTTSQLLAKNSGTSYDVSWKSASTIGGLPTGGTTNQLLTKNSATDYDLTWTSASTMVQYISSSFSQAFAVTTSGESSAAITAYTDRISNGITRSSGTFTLPARKRYIIIAHLYNSQANSSSPRGVYLRIKNSGGTAIGHTVSAYPTGTGSDYNFGDTTNIYYIDNTGSGSTTTLTVELVAPNGGSTASNVLSRGHVTIISQ